MREEGKHALGALAALEKSNVCVAAWTITMDAVMLRVVVPKTFTPRRRGERDGSRIAVSSEAGSEYTWKWDSVACESVESTFKGDNYCFFVISVQDAVSVYYTQRSSCVIHSLNAECTNAFKKEQTCTMISQRKPIHE